MKNFSLLNIQNSLFKILDILKLPFLWKFSLGFLFGVSSVYFLTNFPSGEFILATLALVLFLLKRKFYFFSSFMLGFVFLNLFIANLFQQAPVKNLLDKKIIVIGKVDKLYQHQRFYFDFIVKSTSLKNQAPVDFSGKVRISWYKTDTTNKNLLPKTGETWRLEIKLKQLNSILNPNVRDFTSTKVAQGIIATAFVGKNYSSEKLKDADFHKNFRKNWLDKLTNSNIKGIAYINAITLGDTSLLQNSDWRLFKKTGTLHLWIISGLHLGMIAGFLWLIFRFFTKKKLRLFFVLAISAPIIYAILSGWGVAAQRASFMLVAASLLSAGIRNINVWTSFFLALLIVLLANPLIVLTGGFWLSFGAVGSLIFALKARRIGKLRALLLSQLVVFICLMPFLYYFVELPSFFSPLFNLVLIPLVSILLPFAMVGVLLFLTLDISFLLELSASGFFYLVEILSFFNSYIWSLKPQNPQLLWLGFLFILPSGFYIRFLGLIAFFLAFVKTPVALNPNWKVHILDVGQGLAVLIEKNSSYILFDTGINYSEDFAPVIAPLNKIVKHSNLDYLIVSHKDKDHSGGQDLILQEFEIWRNIGFKGEKCTGAWQEDWQNLKLTFIGADYETKNPKNAESCTLLIQDSANNSALITGDILAQQEFEYLPTWQKLLNKKYLDLLIAAHHGSASSSTKELVYGLRPKFVVYSAGYKNYFKHPSKRVIKRFEKINSHQLNTATEGAISFTFNSKSTQAPVSFSTQKQKRQYLWDYLRFK